MTAIETNPRFETYVREQAVSGFLAAFDLADKEQGVSKAFGGIDGLINIVGTPLWCQLNPDDDGPSPEVEYADGQAALLAARMCRVLIDDPELLRYRAAWLEQWAAEVFARHGGRDG